MTLSVPRALVSLHDVSPLTLPACRQAVALFTEVGLPADRLTCFVIPFHEAAHTIDGHPETVRFLSTLADGGATLAMHGLTHRMTGRARTPKGWFQAHLFARGQGEFFRSDAVDAERRLDQGRTILRRAGLGGALRGFVPPAWLLSPAARAVVDRAGFEFYELFGGIWRGAAAAAGDDRPQRPLARRVIGWGSLSELEARATAVYAHLQSCLPAAADLRVAVHPADLCRPSQRRALRRVLSRVLGRHEPVSYSTYLGT